MEKSLLIEVADHSTSLIIPSKEEKINFRDYSEELASTLSSIKLYLIDDEYYYDNDNKHKELIATIYGRYFDINYANDNRISLYEVFDEPNCDSASLIPYLLDDEDNIKQEYLTIENNIYYLDRLEVEEKYRSQGYAKFLLENLPEILMYVTKISIGIIIIQAQPFDNINGESIMDYEDDTRKERLIKLYENTGFTRIDDSNYLIYINE